MTSTDTTTQVADQLERVTRRDLAEGKIEKVLGAGTSLVPISESFGGLRFDNAMQVAEAAKLMSTAGPLLPPWLQGNVGGCWGIIIRANELNISPLALANWSYVTSNHGVERVAFESGFYHAVIEARAPIKERLRHVIIGEGDERRCRVWATFKNEAEPREFTSETLSKLRPARNERGQIKGSPLWERKPEVQLFYDACRDWARINCPDVLAGLYTRDELNEYDPPAHIGAEKAKDVTPRLRLGAARADRANELRAHTEAAFNTTDTDPADGSPASSAGTDAAGSPAAASAAPPSEVITPPHPEAEDGGAPIETEQTSANDRQAEAPAEDGGAGSVSRTGAATEDQGGAAQTSGMKNSIDAAPGTGQPSVASNNDEPADIAEAFRKGKEARRQGLKKRAVPPEYRDTVHSRQAARWMAGWQDEDDAMAGRQ